MKKNEAGDWAESCWKDLSVIVLIAAALVGGIGYGVFEVVKAIV
jgi:hypothetical protein